MADVNKSIEISMTADLKSLQKQLSKIPGMTKEEAQGMTKALQRELRQAQAAAKKTADVNKVAMKQVAQSTDAAARSARNLRTQTRQMGSAFGAMESVVGEISPELGGMASTIGGVGMAFSSLSKAIATGNPLVLGLLGGVTALTAAYSFFTSESRKAEEIQKALAESLENTKKKLEQQTEIASSVTNDYNAAARELKVFKGEMTQLDADILNAKEAIQAKTNKELDSQDKIIAQQQALVSLVKKAKEDSESLTKEEEKKINVLLAENKVREYGGTLASNITQKTVQLNTLEDKLLKTLYKEQTFRMNIVAGRDGEYQATKELLLLQDEVRKAQEEQNEIEARKAKQQEANARASQAYAERQRKLSDGLKESISAREQAEKRIEQIQISRLTGEDQINANARVRTEEIEKEKEALQEQFAEMEKIAKSKKDSAKLSEIDFESAKAFAALSQEQNEIEKQRLLDIDKLKKKLEEDEQKRKEAADKKEEKRKEEQLKQYVNLSKLQIQSISEVFSFGLQLATESGNKNKTLINVLFRANQAASLANVAMATAEAVAKAPAQYGPLAPLAIPAIVASGAVQAGIVLSQKPPLHMGGIVQPLAPDEQQRTLLTGEAVLDRATTRRLGEEGVRSLQNGKSMSPNVIVMNPFKHLDRYNRSALKNPNSSFAQLQPTRRSRY